MKWIKRILLVLAAVFIILQFIPVNRANPPVDAAKVLQAPPNVQSILDRSCKDCHSNRTEWPWYARIAPVSMWMADHVKDGRREVNFDEFNTYSAKRRARKMKEICEQVEEHEMPLWEYLPLHRRAKLSDADIQTLCAWTKSLSVPSESSRSSSTAVRRE